MLSVCLWVRHLHFFQYKQACKRFADPVPPHTKQYQLILIKYQPVSSYTDPVPSSTTYNSSSCKAQFSQLNNFSFYDSFDESRIIYLVQFFFSDFQASNFSQRPVKNHKSGYSWKKRILETPAVMLIRGSRKFCQGKEHIDILHFLKWSFFLVRSTVRYEMIKLWTGSV